MKYYKTIILLLLFLVTACEKEKIYEEYHQMKNQSWNKFSLLKFDFQVDNINNEYNMYFAVRLTNSFQDKELSFNAELFTPCGEQRLREISIDIIKQSDNNQLTGKTDFTEIIYPLYNNFKFDKKGSCLLEIQNSMEKYETPGIYQIGLIVERD